jgi:hypothetical protein
MQQAWMMDKQQARSGITIIKQQLKKDQSGESEVVHI